MPPVRSVVAVALSCTLFFALGWGSHVLASRASGQRPDAMHPVASSSLSPSAPPLPSASGSASTEEVFSEIYKSSKWGTNGGDAGASGYGSTMRATYLYRAFLQQFMKDLNVRSVVDAGCGDWESTGAIDWTGIDYKGYDIVASVVAADNKKFAKPGVQFFHANIVTDDLPPADLLICKQVLQHLPTADIERFLSTLHKYAHVLLIDSVNPATLSAKNTDTAAGGFRFLDLTHPPFNLKATKVLTYWDGGSMEQVLYIPR